MYEQYRRKLQASQDKPPNDVTSQAKPLNDVTSQGKSLNDVTSQPPVAMERTFLMIKPDGVQRGLMAAVIGRFEKKGYKLVAMKFMQANEDLLAAHYAEHEGKPFYEGLLKYIMSGPVLAMVWEGREVISTCRTIIGATNPLKAAPGTIRGDYGLIAGRNIIHGSDSVESASREMGLWFTEEELVSWQANQDSWLYES